MEPQLRRTLPAAVARNLGHDWMGAGDHPVMSRSERRLGHDWVVRAAHLAPVTPIDILVRGHRGQMGGSDHPVMSQSAPRPGHDWMVASTHLVMSQISCDCCGACSAQLWLHAPLHMS